MDEFKNKPEPKRIKMPPLVDRSKWYDIMEYESDIPPTEHKDENYSENNSQSISELDSL